VLQSYNDLVFAYPASGGVQPEGEYHARRFRRAVRVAGLDPRGFHDHRRTFGTRRAAAGRTPFVCRSTTSERWWM
jgi:integrase